MIKQAVSAFAAAAVAVSFASAAFAENASVVEKLPVTNFELTNDANNGAKIDEDNQQIILTYTSKNPDNGQYISESYLTYTAPADGTVTFTFKANKSNGTKNTPKLYWTYDNDGEPYIKSEASSHGARIDAAGANSPTPFSFNVTKGTVYHIYGWIWFGNGTCTTYTLNDFKFTSTADITAAEEYEPTDYNGTDKGFTAEFTGANAGIINWYAKSSDAAAYSKIGSDNTVVSGNADYVAGLVISGINGDDFDYEIGASIN